MRSPCAVFCAFLLAGIGTGQTPSFDGTLPAQQRLATAGRVLDAAGQPLLAATVTFVGSEPPIGDRFSNADRVVVTTDDKGRFRAELLVGSDYSCWAATPVAADGMRFITRVQDGVRAGTGIELKAVPARAPRLQVTGAAAWQDIGPLRFEIAIGVAHLYREALAVTGGVADLPALPHGAPWFVFAIDATGVVLCTQRFDPTPDGVRFAIPPPQTIPVRVRDESGAPIDAASIHVRTSFGRGSSRHFLIPPPRGSEWRLVGHTGPDGTASVLVPCREDPFSFQGIDGPLLLATKPDHAGTAGGFGKLTPQASGTPRARELALTMRAAQPWRVRILDESGHAVPPTVVRLATGIVLRTTGGGVVPDVTFTPRPGDDGWLLFDMLTPALEATTLLVHTSPAADSRPNVAKDGPREPRHVRAPALLTPRRDQPLDLDLRTLPMLTLRVTDASGGPARDASVVMVPLPIDSWQPNDATHAFHLDATGAARTRVQPGRWFVFVTDRSGFTSTDLDVTRSQDLALQLEQLASMRGRVLGPKAGGNVEFSVHSHVERVPANDDVSRAMRAVAYRANSWLAANTSVAADGTFTLRFVDVPGSSFEGWVAWGGRSVRLWLRPSTDEIEFDLRKQ